MAFSIAQTLLGGINNMFHKPAIPVAKPIAPPSKTAPQLKTEGNKILRADTGQQVILKGATSDYFRGDGWAVDRGKNGTQQTSHEDMLKRVGILNKDGLNLLLLYFSNPDLNQQKTKELDQTIAFAKKNGIQVGIIPVTRDFNNQQRQSFVTKMADRYKNENNVIYGLSAEGDLPLEEQQKMAAAVRAKDPKALVMYESYQQPAQGDLGKNALYYKSIYLFDRQDNKKGIYDQFGYKSEDQWVKDKIGGDFSGYVGSSLGRKETRPLVIGEFGGFSGEGFSNPQDLSLMKKEYDAMQKSKTSFAGYRLEPQYIKSQEPVGGNSPTGRGGELGLFEPNNNLTARGKLLVENLKSDPLKKPVNSSPSIGQTLLGGEKTALKNMPSYIKKKNT